jgi:hypothetical protein
MRPKFKVFQKRLKVLIKAQKFISRVTPVRTLEDPNLIQKVRLTHHPYYLIPKENLIQVSCCFFKLLANILFYFFTTVQIHNQKANSSENAGVSKLNRKSSPESIFPQQSTSSSYDQDDYEILLNLKLTNFDSISMENVEVNMDVQRLHVIAHKITIFDKKLWATINLEKSYFKIFSSSISITLVKEKKCMWEGLHELRNHSRESSKVAMQGSFIK